MASLGEGIGLQDKPNLFGGIAAQRMAAFDSAAARAEMARQKTQEKDQAAFDKVISSKDVHLDPKMWEKPFLSAATAEYKNWLEKALKIRKDNPNDWQTGVQQSLVELNDHLSHLKNGNDILRQHIKDVQEGKVHADPNGLNKMYSTDYTDVHKDPQTGAFVSSAWEDLQKSIDPIYGFSFDKSGNVAYNPVQKFDFQAKNQGFLNDSNVWTAKGTSVRPLKGAPDLYEKVTTKIVDPIQREQYINTVTQDPNAVRSWIVSNKDAVEKTMQSDPSFDFRNPNSFIDLMKADLRANLSGQKNETSSFVDKPQRPPAEKKDVQEVTVNPSGRTMTVGAVYNNTDPNSPQQEAGIYTDTDGKTFYKDKSGNFVNAVTKKVETPNGEVAFTQSSVGKNVTSKGSAEFSAVEVQTAPEFHFNLETGKEEKVRGPIKYTISGIEKLPYVLDAKGNAIVAPDDVIAKYPNTIKYGWFATGLEKAGTKDGELVTKPRAIPLTKQVFDQLKAKKVNISGITDADFWTGKGGKEKPAEAKKTEEPKVDKKVESLRSKYGY